MISSSRIRVLVAEDEEHLGNILEQFLTGRGYHVTVVRDGNAALGALRAETFDVALLDIVMPEVDGLEILRQLRADPHPPEVIIITGNGTIETAITAIRLGAYDYLSKPYRMAEIDVLVRRAWEKRELGRENALLHTRLERVDPLPDLVTQYGPMQEVLTLVSRVAKSDSPVLITGESGTGKELIARALHRLSERGNGPLVDINCVALAGAVVESELFGYEKGAFPGATSRKPGLFELASGGSLFMDEIGGLEHKLQGTLLRALEQGAFFRVGGTQKVTANVRLITATNKDLPGAVADGSFRSDLFYRINTIAIALPPLRERASDIPLLTEHFLQRFGGTNAPGLTEGALAAMLRYRWPGNVRELRNVIERAVLLNNGGLIDVRDLPLVHKNGNGNGAGNGNGNGNGHGHGDLDDEGFVSLLDMERGHIESVLHHANWHQGRAATILGISSKTLYRKIREYGFQRPSGAYNGR